MVFILIKDCKGDDKMYVLLYLDDLIIASKKENEIIDLERKLTNEFEMKDLGKLKSFHGLEINQDREKNILTISI